MIIHDEQIEAAALALFRHEWKKPDAEITTSDERTYWREAARISLQAGLSAKVPTK